MLFTMLKKRISETHQEKEVYQDERLLSFDKNLLGFIPLRTYFIRNKKSFKEFVDEKCELKTKEHAIFMLCEKLLFSDGDHPDYFQYEQEEEEKTALEDILNFEDVGHTINVKLYFSVYGFY